LIGFIEMASLTDPIKRLSSELAWLREEFLAASASRRTRREQLAAEMAVIRLQDAWARFCRELIIMSASGNSVTLNGSVVPAVIRKRSDVVPALLATYKKRRQYEPKWERAVDCIDAATRLKVANLGTLAAALGSTNSPADEIRHIRNFYAHRRQGAAARALSCNVFSGTRPIVFDLAAYKSAGERHIDYWTTGLVLVATAASQ
jgi:hypothetical protein